MIIVQESLGMLEVKGLVAAIEVADTMVKAASVKLQKLVRARGFGWTTIGVLGDVGAVQAAIEAGQAMANSQGWFVSAKVIPRPSEGLEELFEQFADHSPSEVDQVPIVELAKSKPAASKIAAAVEPVTEVKAEVAQPVAESKENKKAPHTKKNKLSEKHTKK